MIITLLIHIGEYIKMTEKCKSMLSVDDVTFSVVWENGCVVKTPFCKSIFTANCESGCAAIHIRNHNLTTLPKNIVELKNIRRLEVTGGPVTWLVYTIIKVSTRKRWQ